MRLKKEEIEKLARKLFRDLKGKEFVEVIDNETLFTKKVFDVIYKNMKEEDDLDNDVKKVLSKYEAQFNSGELDYHKMFELVKKQLVKEKGIII